jgi:hypothetical protein
MAAQKKGGDRVLGSGRQFNTGGKKQDFVIGGGPKAGWPRYRVSLDDWTFYEWSPRRQEEKK